MDNDVIADPDSDSTHATVDSVPDAASIPDSVSGARNKAVDDRVVRDVVMAEGEMIREELPVEDEANPVQSSQFFSEKRRWRYGTGRREEVEEGGGGAYSVTTIRNNHSKSSVIHLSTLALKPNLTPAAT